MEDICYQQMLIEKLFRQCGDFNKYRKEKTSVPNSRSSSVRHRTNQSILIKRSNSIFITPNRLSLSSIDILEYRRKQPKRIRSFKTSLKGVTTTTEGDRRDSVESVNNIGDTGQIWGSDNTHSEHYMKRNSKNSINGYYRVCVMGGEAVGKRTILNQFTSSSSMTADVLDIEGQDENVLSVTIDNEESTVEFVEFTEKEENSNTVDAYIVVFSVHERKTYEVASQYIDYIHNEKYSDRPIIMVANKVDLVRRRQVSTEEANHLAKKLNCKYIETSATLNLKIDELFVGILKQIKLTLNPVFQQKPNMPSGIKCFKGTRTFLNKLFHLKAKTIACTNVMC